MKRPVLRYFGGKFILAPWIISHFPKHKVYVEPFGGAASVLMRKTRSYAEIYNDIDDQVYNLFVVLQSPKKARLLQNLLMRTPYARREFELAHVFHPDPIENARRLIIRSFMGFGSDSTLINSKTGFRSNSNRSGTTPAHDWLNYPKALPEFQKRLGGVVIDCKDAKLVMAEHDSPDTLHYIDPPYAHDTRKAYRYNHEMTMVEHVELLNFLRELKGFVVLSGYQNDLYESLGWHRVDRKAFADGAKERTESLWLNPRAKENQHQPEFIHHTEILA